MIKNKKKQNTKKKKKRGFTIVELLAVIVILAIIITLAVNGYGKVSVNVKQKAFANLKTLIETKAGDYASDTGNLLTNVGELVHTGYIEASDEEGNLKNPVDGSILNCHIVSITKENEVYYGKYSDEEECEVSNLTITNLNLVIKAYETTDGTNKGKEITTGEWTKENILLEAELGEKIDKNNVKKITWQSNIETKENEVNNDYDSKNTYVVSAEQIINTTYYVTIEMNDSTSYQTSREVKIDKQRPILYETKIENENKWTSSNKKVWVSAGDGSGSGIYGYYIGDNSKCNEVEYTPKESNTYEEEKEVGEYYVCVKDKAGNVSEDESKTKIKVEKIDKEPPKIEVLKEPLKLGKEDYKFETNVKAEWGDSGEGEVNCNPAESLKTGVYNVTCTAVGNNGLMESVTFEVKHNYPATRNPKTCSREEEYNCHTESGRSSVCSHVGWGYCGNANVVGIPSDCNCLGACAYVCDAWEHTPWTTRVCDHRTVQYDCSWYSCPSGGTLRGTTCYYE